MRDFWVKLKNIKKLPGNEPLYTAYNNKLVCFIHIKLGIYSFKALKNVHNMYDYEIMRFKYSNKS